MTDNTPKSTFQSQEATEQQGISENQSKEAEAKSNAFRARSSEPGEKYKLKPGQKSIRALTAKAQRTVGQQSKRFQSNAAVGFEDANEEYEQYKRTKNGYVRTLQEILREKEIQERSSSRRRSFKMVPPVNTDQVSDVCRAVNMKLSLMHITTDQLLEKFLFPESSLAKGTVSVSELISSLVKDPFKLQQQDAENLSRYMIEDNTQNVIQFRLAMSADNQLVRSRFKYIIGRVRIFTPEEEKKLQKELGVIMKKHCDNIYSQLSLNADVKKNLLASREQIFKAFDYLDVELTKSQTDYYFLKLFERTQEPNKFNLDDCSRLFLKYYENTI